MEKNYKTIPFDVNRINEEGVEVITRNGKSARIICVDKKIDANLSYYPIVALVSYINKNSTPYELTAHYTRKGKTNNNEDSPEDLFLKIPVKTRRMTYQELSWWLRECPEEHREYKFKTNPLIYHEYIYKDDDVNEVIDNRILIRSNGGEWKEPLIEIE